MSSDRASTLSSDGDTESEREYFPPLTSAGDFNRGNYPRARFDDGLAFAIKEEARRRAPNKKSEFNHRVGVAAEFTYSGYEQEPINRTVYDDFVGDDGCDVTTQIGGTEYRVQIKCVCTGSLELRVDEERAHSADYFVLCRTSNPLEMVEMIGCVNRGQLFARGEKFPGENTLRIRPDMLEPFEPLFITPDRIREAQVERF